MVGDAPLVVQYWADLQLVHGLRSCGNTGNAWQSVVIAKHVYAASAWYGLYTAAYRDRLEAVIRQGIRSGLCSTDQLSVRALIDDADDSLFSHPMNN